jgi:L-rhamnonate dehydratase
VQITRTQAITLENVPVEPPPFRPGPTRAKAVLVKMETTEGLVGWSLARHTNPLIAHFINAEVAPRLQGEDSLRIERIWRKLENEFYRWKIGGLFTFAMSAVDIALWDLKGKALGLPVHQLLGGASDEIDVYITHGAAYGDAPVYDLDELAAEAAHLVKLGNRFLKHTVARQPIPDPDDDYRRMKAIREAVGPDVKLAMDAAAHMSVPQAVRLCRLTEELDIAFLEEPVHGNDPRLMADVRRRTSIPIAAAEREGVSCLDLLTAGAVDIIQPNVNNDGGFTGAARIATIAKAFRTPIGHGNAGGPHNVALQAGLSNGSIVEYHYLRWMEYNAIFEGVPQPEAGRLAVSQRPGVGLEPRPGLIAEHAVE